MQPSVQIAVVADDLTGALDAMAPFADAGLRCVVATGPAHLAAALANAADIVAVSTASRELSEAMAMEISQLVADLLSDVPLVVKKIDSRLKGHVGAETAVLARHRGLKRVLLCPAIPDMGRIVRAGELRGFGVERPLSVASCLSNCSELDLIVPDVESDADIDRLLASIDPNTLLVGARGLTAGLARRLSAKARRSTLLPLPRPLAFAIGTRDPITLDQVRELRRCHPQAAYFAAPNGLCAEATSTGDLAIMQATQGSTAASPAAVTAALAGCFVRDLVPGRACLVLTGGETATAVLNRMNIGVLRVLGEAVPGLPLCQPLDLPLAPLILTKSGGFGANDVLNRLL